MVNRTLGGAGRLPRLGAGALVPGLCLAFSTVAAAHPDPAVRVPTAGLVAWFPLDGNSRDASGQGRDGTPVEAVPARDRFGVAGAACACHADEAAISVPFDDGLPADQGLTLTAWAYPMGGGTILQQGGWCPDGAMPFRGQGFSFGLDGEGRLGMAAVGADGNFSDPVNKIFSVRTVPSDGRWHHVAGVFDAGEMALYIDGERDEARTAYFTGGDSETRREAPATEFRSLARSTDVLRVGGGYSYCDGQAGPENTFHGLLDEIRIYDRPLSGGELRGMGRAADGPAAAVQELGYSEMESAWSELMGGYGPAAYDAAWRLALSPEGAVALLADRIRPVPEEGEKIRRLILDLDDERYDDRERASQELASLGELAEPDLREAQVGASEEVRTRAQVLLDRLAVAPPSLEVRQAVAGVEMLERIGTGAARDLLGALSQGAPGARATREARAALGRMENSGVAEVPE